MFNPDLLNYIPISFFVILGAGVVFTTIMLAIEHKGKLMSPQLAAYAEVPFAEIFEPETLAEPAKEEPSDSAYTAAHWYLAPLLAEA